MKLKHQSPADVVLTISWDGGSVNVQWRDFLLAHRKDLEIVFGVWNVVNNITDKVTLRSESAKLVSNGTAESVTIRRAQ